jgi:hypothetical protein
MNGFTLPPRDIVLPSAFALIGSGLGVAIAAVLVALMTRPAGAGEVTYRAWAPERCAPATIKRKLAEVAAQCGPVEVISTLRVNARVRGSGKPSLHRFCSPDIGAVDFRIRNYACARGALADWTGGQSTDPFAVGHLHIDVRKKPIRFAHRPKHKEVAAAPSLRREASAHP